MNSPGPLSTDGEQAAAPPTPWYTFGVGGVIMRDDRVLLVRQTYGAAKGRWLLPSGHVKPGEPLEQAAAREVWEEAGVHATAACLVGVRSRIYPDGRHDVYIVFRMHDDGGEPRPDGRETSEAVFWDVAAALASEEVTPLTRSMIQGGLGTGLSRKEIGWLGVAPMAQTAYTADGHEG